MSTLRKYHEPKKADDWEKPAWTYHGKLFQTNLTLFYNKLVSSVNMEKAMEFVYLHFSKMFNADSSNFPLEKLE